MVSGTNPAIAHALQSPPLLKAGATAQAVEITMFKKALEQEGKAALALLQSAVTGKGVNINVSA